MNALMLWIAADVDHNPFLLPSPHMPLLFRENQPQSHWQCLPVSLQLDSFRTNKPLLIRTHFIRSYESLVSILLMTLQWGSKKCFMLLIVVFTDFFLISIQNHNHHSSSCFQLDIKETPNGTWCEGFCLHPKNPQYVTVKFVWLQTSS